MDYRALRNLPTMFFDQCESLGDRPFLWAKNAGEWQNLTWAQTAEQVTVLSRGLRALGVEKGDRVMLVSENRPEWLIADLAIMSAGAITVPTYTTNSTDDHAHILGDSGAKGIIVSTKDLARLALPAASKCPETEFAVCIEPPEHEPGQGLLVSMWDDVLTKGRAMPDDVRERASKPERGETCCLIYTSGTGGRPKGVMLSHGAIICNAMGAYGVIRRLPGFQEPGETFLSFLPLSHSYEHMAGQFFPMSIGADIYYAESLEKLVANLAETKPTIMTAVPRLYESIYGRITRGLVSQSKLKQFMFAKALELGRKRYENPGSLSFGEKIFDAVLDRLVRAKVAGRFGGRLKAFVSGGAPLNYDIGIFFISLGLRLLQGYGQTESAPVIAVNVHDNNKIDTVGPPMEDVEVKIAADGEILVRGELLMNGYWRNPEATAETIVDGWLHTGDIGVFDNQHFLRITDRKKDLIVNSGGDNISPQRIEGMLEVEPEIGQVMVYGDRQSHLVALIVADPDFMASWAKQAGVTNDLAALAADENLHKAIAGAVDRVNGKLSNIERVRRFVLAPEEFTTDNEMMTPTKKIRRHVIKEKYGSALDALYRG